MTQPVIDTAHEPPAAGRRAILGLLSESLPRRRGALAGLLLVSAVAAVAEGSGLMLLGIAVPALLNGDAAASLPVTLPVPVTLPTVLAGYLLLAALAAGAVYARVRYVGRLRADTVARLRGEVMQAVLTAEWSWLRRQRAAELTRIATADTGQVAHGVEFVANSASILLRVPVLLAVAGAVSPGLTASVVAGCCLALVAAGRIHRDPDPSRRAVGEAWRRLHARVADIMAGRRIVKAGGLEHATLRDLESRSRAWQALARDREAADALRRCLYQTGLAAAVAGGLLLAVHGFRLGLAEALVAILALARAGQTGLVLNTGWRVIRFALTPYAVIRETLAAAAAQHEAAGDGTVEPPRRAIVLDRVTASHGDGDGHALHELSAVIPAGAMTAIVGPSGAGKSTLVDLLLGMTAPESGHVLLDDRPLDAAARPAWRRLTGYLPQHPFLFDGSIRGNLQAACPEADEAAMLRALADADAAGLVASRPLGLDAEVGENGDRLSGGERQRIALACALLRRPALLVLDEPTSGLDADSANRIAAALARQAGERTIVIVTHRPELAELCATRIRLRDGRVEAA